MAVISGGRLNVCIGVNQMKRNRRKIPGRANKNYEYLDSDRVERV